MTALSDGPDRIVRSRPSVARFPCFDGVRAVAALGVIVFHAVLFTSLFRGAGGRFLVNLNTGVWVFFVTSGFLLYLPYARAHLAGAPPVGIRGYLARRAARIYPGYWLALAFFTLLVPKAVVVGTRGFVLHTTLTQTYASGQLFSGISVAWSLVVEVSFYAFLPLYAAAIGWLGQRWAPVAAELLGVTVLGVAGVGSTLLYVAGHAPRWVTVLPFHLHVFALGMVLAVLAARRWGRRTTAWLTRAGNMSWLWWTLALTTFLAIPLIVGVVPGEPVTSSQEVAGELCRALVGVFVVIPVVLGPQRRGAVRWLLRSPALAYLGVVSYGLYLWHYLLLQTVQSDWLGWRRYSGNPVVLLLCTFPVVILAATASWHFVEHPVIHLARRVGQRRAALDP